MEKKLAFACLAFALVLLSGCLKNGPPVANPPVNGTNNTNITNFEQCAAAGYPVLESYPRQCRTPDNRTFSDEKNYFRDKASCEANNGLWEEMGGITERQFCNFPTKDAGKECTDTSQCENFCIAIPPLDGEPEAYPAYGRCAEWKTIFGCIQLIEDGKRGTAVCLD